MNSKLITVLRIILGIILIVFGANKFFNFMPSPEGMPEAAANFITALVETGYTFKFIGAIEIFTGILFLTNKWVPFALLLIAPVIVNIMLFHLALDMKSMLPGTILSILVIILFYNNWDKYKALF